MRYVKYWGAFATLLLTVVGLMAGATEAASRVNTTLAASPTPEVGTTGTVQRSVRVLRRAWDDRCARLTLYRSEGAGSSRTRFEKGLRRARGCTTWTIPPQYLLALHGRSGIRLYSGGEFAVPGTRGCES
jgi:hypothetical protein